MCVCVYVWTVFRSGLLLFLLASSSALVICKPSTGSSRHAPKVLECFQHFQWNFTIKHVLLLHTVQGDFQYCLPETRRHRGCYLRRVPLRNVYFTTSIDK